MKSTYKNLLIDRDTYPKVATQEFLKCYDYICIPAMIEDIEYSRLYEFEIAGNQEIKTIDFKEFINDRNQKNDIKEWLYISKNITNLCKLQEKYKIPCCFFNVHCNDAVDIAMEHEVNSIEKINKLLVK